MYDVPKWRVVKCSENSLVPLQSQEFLADNKLNVYSEVLQKGFIRIQLTDSALSLYSTGYIGLIPLNSTTALDVQPKVPIANLERLLSVAEGPALKIVDLYRQYSETDPGLPSLMDVIAQAFVKAIEFVISEGRLRQYEYHKRTTAFPRGRIHLGDTLRRSQARGRYDTVVASAYEQTVDVPVNRLLKYALWKLASRYERMPKTRAVRHLLNRISAAFQAFDGVYLDHRLSFQNDRLVRDPELLTPIRDYYQRAVWIAKLIVASSGIKISSSSGNLILPTILLNLDDVFEAYVRKLLQEAAAGSRQFAALDGNLNPPRGASKRLFDQPALLGANAKACPDVLIIDLMDESPRAVIEVKYKGIASMADRHDVAQTLVYGLTYDCGVGILAHPKIENGVSGLQLVGRIGSIMLYQYAMDLEQADWAAMEVAFTKDIFELISAHDTKSREQQKAV
jgi:5-methylcytosine-specific restriction enzyme subunit McrC